MKGRCIIMTYEEAFDMNGHRLTDKEYLIMETWLCRNEKSWEEVTQETGWGQSIISHVLTVAIDRVMHECN
jgi:hypothetical protein